MGWMQEPRGRVGPIPGRKFCIERDVDLEEWAALYLPDPFALRGE